MRRRELGRQGGRPRAPDDRRRRRRAATVAAVLLAATACSGGSGGDTSGATDASRDGEAGEDIGAAVGDVTTSSTAAPSTTAAPPRTTAPTPVDLAVSGVTADSTAEPGFDACQTTTTYEAGNVADGAQDTAWRTNGDASGASLTITLDGRHDVVSVGVLPGYNKIDPCDGTDRWAQNRRPTTVTWLFDDGSEITQELRDAREMQTVAVAATTSTVELRIDAVTGSPERDFTAVSEVTIRGT